MEDDRKAANYPEASRSCRLPDPKRSGRSSRNMAKPEGGILRVTSGELMRILAIACLAALPTAALAGGLDLGATDVDGPVYPTFGVHNPPEYSEDCEAPDCLVRRGPDEPSDPLYPLHWVSEWKMYRVFHGLEKFPPPYASPPKGLIEGKDYEVSRGATYYDATWSGATGSGAMMEFYDKRCLPIFPDIDNHFTCAFISLGNIAYFLTYSVDRPKKMPPCCRFSNLNHPPRRDFIKHLPYSAADSARVPGIQAYSLLTPGPGGREILFGYAFETTYRSDEEAPEAGAYRHPQSFYFSGEPATPPNAPIVSQNYEKFRAVKPDPTKTWDLVGKQCTGDIPWCDLFKESQE